MTFTDKRAAAEYEALHKKDYEEFLASQLPNKERIYQEVGYFNLSKKEQEEVNKNIDDMYKLIRSQYTIYNYPHKWK